MRVAIPTFGDEVSPRFCFARDVLLVDIQNDCFPGGAMELVGSPETGAQAGNLLRAFARVQSVEDLCAAL